MIEDTARALVHFEVEPNYAGWTLAEYVAEKLKRPLAPARLDRLLRGRALVHQEPQLLPETRVWPGLRFALRKRSPGDEGEPPAVPVVYQDDALLVVDKPAGLALHPTARYHVSTLTRALETRHRNASGEKPDPAHRLDRETSGLVACGRGTLHTRALKAAFAARQVEKAYLALCEGDPPGEFQVDVPLSVGTKRIKVKAWPDPQGMPAVTTFRVLVRYRDSQGQALSLLRCEPRTGRQQLIATLTAVWKLGEAARPRVERQERTRSASPSARLMRGSYPSTRRALARSAEEARRSPARGAWCSGERCVAAGPMAFWSRAISSRSEALLPPATLTISPGASFAAAASRFARTTSETCTKSRVCRPSP